jgi:hypothetical protein
MHSSSLHSCFASSVSAVAVCRLAELVALSDRFYWRWGSASLQCLVQGSRGTLTLGLGGEWQIMTSAKVNPLKKTHLHFNNI